MTDYCFWGSAEPFITDNDFFKSFKKQVRGEYEGNVFFYNIKYPFFYFYISWSDWGSLILHFHNTLNEKEHLIELNRNQFSFALFQQVKLHYVEYYLPRLLQITMPPSPPKRNFLQRAWDRINSF